MTETWENDAPAADRRFPWPPGEGDPLLGRFAETWRSATFDPATFYRAMPRQAGLGSALAYYLVVGILVAGVRLFWATLGRIRGVIPEQALPEDFGLGAVSPVVSFFLSPVVLLLGLFLAAGVTHLILMLFDAGRHGYRTTVRVFCFAYSPQLFVVVPVLGAIVGTIWMVVLAVIGIREAHETETWRGAVAVVIPFVALLGLFLLLLMFVLASGVALFGGAAG